MDSSCRILVLGRCAVTSRVGRSGYYEVRMLVVDVACRRYLLTWVVPFKCEQTLLALWYMYLHFYPSLLTTHHFIIIKLC
ncbi:hypothetical protein LX32DRAFT_320699 [Colletotrichum zoysiae]|uniref:Uncharacterized protein n=1 Tax=Colletotrichum zoysiae TaxID=1216348 RepID=A0AAD9HM33_9PEZI|nr:hypothetical protein LX32DRAFT_320699 [Colletotrichum zoysiae]